MSVPSAVRVLLADDQALVRSGFRMIVDAEPDLEVVGEAVDGDDVVALSTQLSPDVVLMDLRMPGTDGIEATRRVLARPGNRTRVLVLTTFDLDDYVYEAMRAGASGFLVKDVRPEELVHAIRTVAEGNALLAPSVLRRMLDRFVTRRPPGSGTPPVLATLTERELEVLTWVARGRSNAEIATELFLGENTVKTHVTHVLQKLGLRDRVQAVVLAYECGLVEPGRNDDGRADDASGPRT
jgi:DNA-binding NarL/FixJ family response regulator